MSFLDSSCGADDGDELLMCDDREQQCAGNAQPVVHGCAQVGGRSARYGSTISSIWPGRKGPATVC